MNIEIDFTVKKKYFYLFENPSLYPEEQCNIKYNIFDDEYLINFMESQKNEMQKVKSMNGILPNMKVKINEDQYSKDSLILMTFICEEKTDVEITAASLSLQSLYNYLDRDRENIFYLKFNETAGISK